MGEVQIKWDLSGVEAGQAHLGELGQGRYMPCTATVLYATQAQDCTGGPVPGVDGCGNGLGGMYVDAERLDGP